MSETDEFQKGREDWASQPDLGMRRVLQLEWAEQAGGGGGGVWSRAGSHKRDQARLGSLMLHAKE